MEGTDISQEKKSDSRAKLAVHIDGDIFDAIQKCRIMERQRTNNYPTQSEFVEQYILRPWFNALKEDQL